MATASTLHVMTLGPQQKTMTSLIQPASNAASACGALGGQPAAGHLASPHQGAAKAATAALLQQKRALAPADARASTAGAPQPTAATAADMLRCKRRINFTHGAHLAYAPGHQPASVARRNARERNRVKQVNNGFATLRSRIPVSVAAALSSSSASGGASPHASAGGRGASKKLSKVETLRMAVEYIRSLQQLLEEHTSETASPASSASSTTPEPGAGTPAVAAASAGDTGYYSSSPESTASSLLPVNSQYSAGGAPSALLGPQPSATPMGGASLSPPCSEASSSPTPSYASEGSGAYPPPAYQPEAYENYEPMSPEDEELLDVISWWQQSQ